MSNHQVFAQQRSSLRRTRSSAIAEKLREKLRDTLHHVVRQYARTSCPRDTYMYIAFIYARPIKLLFSRFDLQSS